MYRIQVGILCLVMVFVFGLALNVAGQDKSEPEAAVEDMCVPMGVIELKPDPSVEQKKSSVELTSECRVFELINEVFWRIMQKYRLRTKFIRFIMLTWCG